MIGERLKLARTAAGLSLRALESKIESRVTAQAIGKYERNQSMPGSAALLALSDALGVSPDYLLGDPTLVLSSVDFRKKRITRKKEQARVEAFLLDHIERYLAVEEILGLPSSRWDRPRGAPYPVRELAEAEQAARSVREYWDIGIDPIPNVVELLEEHGVKVLFLDMLDIDGLAAKIRRGAEPPVRVVVVKKNNPTDRKRFTLVHELAHMVLAPVAGIDEERAAHRFAGAFLMPADALRSAVGKRRVSIGWAELFSLKKLFGASVGALVYRCRELGILGEHAHRSLCVEIARRGWRRPPYEPVELPAEQPVRFQRLCYRALTEGAISEAKAAELLGVTVSELDRRMEVPVA